jgi:hypothetical protein
MIGPERRDALKTKYGIDNRQVAILAQILAGELPATKEGVFLSKPDALAYFYPGEVEKLRPVLAAETPS